jgi:hypothetical protein
LRTGNTHFDVLGLLVSKFGKQLPGVVIGDTQQSRILGLEGLLLMR